MDIINTVNKRMALVFCVVFKCWGSVESYQFATAKVPKMEKEQSVSSTKFSVRMTTEPHTIVLNTIPSVKSQS